MKKIMTSSMVVGLLIPVWAEATVYNISYTYTEQSVYTYATPMNSTGTPDPNHQLDGASEINTGMDNAIPIEGSGWLDTETGDIYLGPIDIEIHVASGSYGWIDWSQTFHGSFNGTSWTWGGEPTVHSGTLVCEYSDSQSCTGQPGTEEGGLDAPFEAPQDYVTSGRTSEIVPLDGMEFTSLSPGGTAIGYRGDENDLDADGQGYFWKWDQTPNQEVTINIEVGEVAVVPVPAALWLFGSAVLGLVGVRRWR